MELLTLLGQNKLNWKRKGEKKKEVISEGIVDWGGWH